MDLHVRDLTRDLYGAWDGVCERSSGAWFFHTTQWLEYTLAYNPVLESRSCGFMVYDGASPVAVVPLVLERQRYGEKVVREFSFGGGWLPQPACVDAVASARRKKVFQTAFEHIARRSLHTGAARVCYRSNPFACMGKGPEDIVPPAATFGFSLQVVPTQVIDLGKDLSDLFREMRKGHRSDIRRGEQELEGFVQWGPEASPHVFASYRTLHEKAAGRVTRPEATFDMMFQWLKQGNGALFGVRRNGRPASFAYVLLYKDCAYYGSACNDPDAEHLPLGHAVQWGILRWLREKGYRYYETGWQHHGPTEMLPASDKEIAISRFKRGFGGVAVPMIVSEKFFDRRLYLLISGERTARLAGSLPEGGAHPEDNGKAAP